MNHGRRRRSWRRGGAAPLPLLELEVESGPAPAAAAAAAAVGDDCRLRRRRRTFLHPDAQGNQYHNAACLLETNQMAMSNTRVGVL